MIHDRSTSISRSLSRYCKLSWHASRSRRHCCPDQISGPGHRKRKLGSVRETLRSPRALPAVSVPVSVEEKFSSKGTFETLMNCLHAHPSNEDVCNTQGGLSSMNGGLGRRRRTQQQQNNSSVINSTHNFTNSTTIGAWNSTTCKEGVLITASPTSAPTTAAPTTAAPTCTHDPSSRHRSN